jgi:TonB family protein
LKKHRKPKHFIKTPGYPGGNAALSEFIRKNLRYPKEALLHKIEGTVIVEFDYNEKGNVIKTKVRKGLGCGCDEEAVRIVNMLKYPKTKNPGMRVTFHSVINIRFNLKNMTTNIPYHITVNKPGMDTKKEIKKPVVYHYTIQINNAGSHQK